MAKTPLDYTNLLDNLMNNIPDEVMTSFHKFSMGMFSSTNERGFISVRFDSADCVKYFISNPEQWKKSARITYIYATKATEAEKIIMHHALEEYDPKKSFVFFLTVKMETTDVNDLMSLYSIIDMPWL